MPELSNSALAFCITATTSGGSFERDLALCSSSWRFRVKALVSWSFTVRSSIFRSQSRNQKMYLVARGSRFRATTCKRYSCPDCTGQQAAPTVQQLLIQQDDSCTPAWDLERVAAYA